MECCLSSDIWQRGWVLTLCHPMAEWQWKEDGNVPLKCVVATSCLHTISSEVQRIFRRWQS